MERITHNPPSITDVDSQFGSLLEAEWFRSKPELAIMRKYPPYGFYVDDDNDELPIEQRCPIRHYGIIECGNIITGEVTSYIFHSVVALVTVPSLVFDNRPVYDNGKPTLLRVEKWSDYQMSCIVKLMKHNSRSFEGFTLPEGYAVFQPRCY